MNDFNFNESFEPIQANSKKIIVKGEISSNITDFELGIVETFQLNGKNFLFLHFSSQSGNVNVGNGNEIFSIEYGEISEWNENDDRCYTLLFFDNEDKAAEEELSIWAKNIILGKEDLDKYVSFKIKGREGTRLPRHGEKGKIPIMWS